MPVGTGCDQILLPQYKFPAEQFGIKSARTAVAGKSTRPFRIDTTVQEMKMYQGRPRWLRSRTAKSIRFEVAAYVGLYLFIR